MRLALGERIRHYRKLKGFSQSELASAMGVHKHTVWGWEDGRSWPEYDKLLAIAKNLEINPEQLFETIGKTPAPPTPQQALEVLAEYVQKPQESAVEKEDPLLAKIARIIANPERRRDLEEFLEAMEEPRVVTDSKRKS